MFFIPFPVIILEILIFTTFVHFFGFWDVFLAYSLPSLLGVLLFSMTGRSMLLAMQRGFAQGQLPGDNVLHRGAVMIGSIFLIIPLFLTRFVAVFLIVPVLRHLSIFIFKTFIFKRLAHSRFSFIRTAGPFGFGSGGFRSGGFGQSSSEFEEPREAPRQERDVEVVNVTPIQITHTKIGEEEGAKDTRRPSRD